jgi:hypothetical protein
MFEDLRNAVVNASQELQDDSVDIEFLVRTEVARREQE